MWREMDERRQRMAQTDTILTQSAGASLVQPMSNLCATYVQPKHVKKSDKIVLYGGAYPLLPNNRLPMRTRELPASRASL